MLHGLQSDGHRYQGSYAGQKHKVSRQFQHHTPGTGSHHFAERHPLALLLGVADRHSQQAQCRNQNRDDHEAKHQRHRLPFAIQFISQIILHVLYFQLLRYTNNFPAHLLAGFPDSFQCLYMVALGTDDVGKIHSRSGRSPVWHCAYRAWG